MHTGQCLCGAIAFEVDGELPAPDICHCSMCRRWSGHVFSGTDIPRGALRIVRGADRVTWYASTPKVRRGFCATCGSSLFFDPIDHEKVPWTCVAMGAFDGPTGVHANKHIYVASKGDYYKIADGLPQNAT